MASFILIFLNSGAGKTVLCNILASEVTPEHGDVALDGVVASEDDKTTDALYERSNVSYCAQFDALFPNKTVEEHCLFYASVRGLIWENEMTMNHINAIITLLGLEKNRHKTSEELSGGYKRRLCLAVSLIGYSSVMMLDEGKKKTNDVA
jgi:ABC-type multidrug transport system ATPase subunit